MRSVASERVAGLLRSVQADSVAEVMGCRVHQIKLAATGEWVPPADELVLWDELLGIHPAQWLTPAPAMEDAS